MTGKREWSGAFFPVEMNLKTPPGSLDFLIEEYHVGCGRPGHPLSKFSHIVWPASVTQPHWLKYSNTAMTDDCDNNLLIVNLEVQRETRGS